MTTQTTLAQLKPVADRDVQSLPAVNVGFTSLQGFELIQRAAKMLASSSLVPKEYQGSIANCSIALNMAMRVGADPLMVMQNLVIVHGRPTWSAQFLIATVNTSGRFTALRYEFFGEPGKDSWGCRAWAIEKATDEKLVGTDVTIAIAKKEGWYAKNGSKWQSIPQQMLMYRAGSWWTRAYAPELSMGLHTADEAIDVYDTRRTEDGSFEVNLAELRGGSKEESATENAANITDAVVEDMPQVSEVVASSKGDDKKPPHDPETGELLSQVADQNSVAVKSVTPVAVLEPKSIPVGTLDDDRMAADWEGWAAIYMDHVDGAATLQSMEKLKKLNAAPLGNLAKANPGIYEMVSEKFTVRFVDLGGMGAA